MKKRLELNIDTNQFIKRLKEFVDTKNEFNSHFTYAIKKPFYGIIEGSTFEIRNTPVLLNNSTTKINGKIENNEIYYSITANNRVLLIIFLISSIIIITISGFFNKVAYFGFGIIPLLVLITFLSIWYNGKEFKKIIHEINDNKKML